MLYRRSENVLNPGETQSYGEQCFNPCNLCGATSIGVLSLKDRKAGYLRTVICKQCGLIWSDPRPDNESIKTFYSKGYRREYKGITIPKKKHAYRDAREAVRRYRFFEDLIEKTDRLLDIGAGNGVFVYCLRRLGYDACGVGPDENHSRFAREVLEVPVSTGFASDVKGYGDYDFATLHHVLEHMSDPQAELRHIRGLLKPGGKLVVEVPNAEDIQQDPKNRYHKAHLYTFNPESLIALGQNAGFKALRKVIAPFNGNISVIFQKTDTVDQTDNLSGNYPKLTALLNKHTNAYHFRTAVPYRKLLHNAIAAIAEQAAIIRFREHKEVIDAVVDGTNSG